MCRMCTLVRKVVRGEIPDEQIHHSHDYYIIIDDPVSDDKLVIYRTHAPAPLQIFIDTMIETAEAMFPGFTVWYNKANPPEHFYFKMKPPKEAKKKGGRRRRKG